MPTLAGRRAHNRLFGDLREMRDAIRQREAGSDLARLVAGYAWPWKSKKDPTAFDIELDGWRFRWNTTAKDWINSRGALDEVGSIHTVQGYDLNYAGVIIGPDLTSDGVACSSIATTTSTRRARRTIRSSASRTATTTCSRSSRTSTPSC